MRNTNENEVGDQPVDEDSGIYIDEFLKIFDPELDQVIYEGRV